MERGAQFGAYQLVEVLGAGGMGVVWRAHDDRLRRDVALKVLPPHLARDQETLLRFEREARGLAALSHPNIVSIFDLGEVDGVRYIVTELLRGETLRTRLRLGPLPWAKAVEIAAAVADGLAAAHAKGIIHRDLKPENIFLTDDGRVKILDFGIARELSPPAVDAVTAVHKTEPGYVLGTLGYISPEQLRGKEADFASDVFSLGAVLYEMLAGRPAFLRETSPDTIAAILTSDPPPLEPSTGLPPEVGRILSRCLEKQPRARFQSASDLAYALRDVTLVRSAAHPVPRRRGWTIAGITALVLLAVAGAFIVKERLSRNPSVGATRTAQRMSLAITPFEAGAEESYAGAGLAESLFRRFASLDSVDVVARKTSPRELSLAEVGARNVLRGKVTRRGGDLEVEAEIVAVPGGRRLWSERYVAPASDLLTLDHRLSSDVEKFLGGSTAKAPQQARSSTVDPDAYREYLKGRYYWNKFSVEGFRTALGHFQASIDEDPTFALAWAGLADTYLMLGFYDDDGDENMPKARAAAERAVTLDSQLGEGWTSLGSVLYLHDWKWRQAEDALRRGVELNPRYTTSHHSYAVYLALVGRFDEALAEINRASELDPLAIVIYVDMAWIQYCAGQQEAGLKTIDKAVRHDPKSPLAHYERSWHLDRLGRYEEAIADLETALALEKKETSSAQKLRNALRRGGKQGYFLQRLELAASGESPHVNRSMLYVWLGDHQSALSELESALAARERDLVYVKTSGALAPLRQYARFQKILDEIGFPE